MANNPNIDKLNTFLALVKDDVVKTSDIAKIIIQLVAVIKKQKDEFALMTTEQLHKIQVGSQIFGILTIARCNKKSRSIR